MQTTVFKRCYDATKRYQSKNLMEKVAVENLKLGDLILVEAQIGRYTEKDPEANNKKGKDSEWKVKFELSSASLLRECPLSLGAADKSKVVI